MSSLATGQGHELKFATIAATASGDTAVVAAVTGKRIRVVSYVFVTDAAISVKFRSATTDITGPMPIAANSGVSCPGQPSSHLFQTVAGAALNINLSGTANVGGHVAYLTEE